MKKMHLLTIRPYINMDTEQQKQSIQKLAALENIRLACTAHWGCTDEFDKAIQHRKQS